MLLGATLPLIGRLHKESVGTDRLKCNENKVTKTYPEKQYYKTHPSAGNITTRVYSVDNWCQTTACACINFVNFSISFEQLYIALDVVIAFLRGIVTGGKGHEAIELGKRNTEEEGLGRTSGDAPLARI
jgi:hypothetical protein